MQQELETFKDFTMYVEGGRVYKSTLLSSLPFLGGVQGVSGS